MTEMAHRVLIADDERFFREAIVEALHEAGIACQSAATGDEALRAVSRDPRVGVVVLDLALEGGREVLGRLRSERPAIRVIALAAHADQNLVLEALRLGATDYLAKPLHDEELVLSVRRALQAFATQVGYERLRGRLRSLDAWLAELVEATHEEGRGLEWCAAEAVADLLGATKTSLMLLDEASGSLRVAAATGSGVPPEEMRSVPLGEGVAGLAVTLDDVLAIDDVDADPRFAERPFRQRYDSGSLAIAPLRAGGRSLGVLCASDREGGVPFGDDERVLLRILAAQVASLLGRDAGAAAAGASGAPPEETAPLPAWQDRVDPDAELAREICDVLTLEVEPARLVAAALRAVARHLAASPVALHLIDNQTGELVLEGQSDLEGRVDRARLPRDRGLTAAVLQTGSLVATDRPLRPGGRYAGGRQRRTAPVRPDPAARQGARRRAGLSEGSRGRVAAHGRDPRGGPLGGGALRLPVP
jgi:CheY-like chemotaxis protein/putative methionine-R-sulfoxide reductase with GAF domain